MHLAILHYHLNRGGVTQAILNHLEALATLPAAERPERVALVSCGRREGWPEGFGQDQLPFACDQVIVPQLEYDASAGASPEPLADAVDKGLAEIGFDVAKTVVHTHNHALGKNASLAGALALLAGRRYRLMLQVHDFAEDFRPANYRHLLRSLRARSAEELAAALYPQAPGIHYATLTGRDHALLAGAGVPADRLHVLPNPVVDFHGLPSEDDARVRVRESLGLDGDARLVVYPVRGIRRKNVGEMLLYSALASGLEDHATCFAVTLAPENPAERASFDRWQALAEEHGLDCRFDIGGHGVAFTDALAGCDAIITTSVAEGFGMVFLEAWLACRPLVGRDLPEITQDFKAQGLKLPGLRGEVLVPLAWIDRDRLRVQLQELHSWACRDFGVAPPDDTAAQMATLLAGDAIDFASLPSAFQAEVIGRVVNDPVACLAEVIAANEGFDSTTMLDGGGQTGLIPANKAVVHRAYSPAAIGARLAAAYAALLADSADGRVEPPSDGASILHSFLRIDRLRPVRIEA